MVDRDIREQFSTWRAKHARPAWVPLFGAVNDAGTWFGGTPSSSTSDVWPECAHCLVPMEFLLQIDLGSLPGESLTPARSGHLQLFYCSTDDGDCPTWEPFSGTEEFRVVTNPVEITYRPEVHAYEEKQVNGWKKVLDYPSPVEHRDLGLIYDYNFDEKVVSVTCSDPMISAPGIDIDSAEVIANPIDGEKLGGWPLWIQGAEYPTCPECGHQMALLLQIDSNQTLDKMWGDVGVAHITYCNDHPFIYAFAWACS